MPGFAASAFLHHRKELHRFERHDNIILPVIVNVPIVLGLVYIVTYSSVHLKLPI